MPLPFAFPIGLILGMTLAWTARAELSRSEVPLIMTRAFLVAVGFGAIVYAPIVGYFLMRHADWAYLYLVRSSRIPSAVDLALVLVAAAQPALGLVLAAPWAIAKRGSLLLKVGIASGALVLVLSIVLSKRLAVSASYAQYHAKFGVLPVSRTYLGRGVLLSWTCLLAAFAWILRALRPNREGT